MFISFLQQDTLNSLEIIVLSIQMFWSFAGIFGVCEFGQRLSSSFEEINNLYDRFKWYLFPCDVQKMLTMLLIVAQHPVELHVFGSISCCRITLKNVNKIVNIIQSQIAINPFFFIVQVFNTAYSWFMILQHLMFQ